MKQLYTSILLLFTVLLFGQTYLMSDTTINTCSGTFYDSGGPTISYDLNEDFTMTFCSDDVNAEIKLIFTYFDLEPGLDNISIYDGIGTTGTLLADNVSGTSLMNTEFLSQGSGCLTFVFTSDGSINYNGWEAEISCKLHCQDFNASFSTNIPFYSTDTIRLCSYDTLNINAITDYYNNNNYYNQNDSTSVFYWYFGDGTDTSGLGLTSVSHIFPQGMHNVLLKISDSNNCFYNKNFIVLRSLEPDFSQVSVDELICQGEFVNLNGYVEAYQSYNSYTGQTFSDTTFIAGNQDAVAVIDYYEFNTTDTFVNISQIENICMNIEYSYIGDLDMWIECPNGQTMYLIEYSNNGGGTFMGEPIALDLPVDANTNNATPGIGYDYCFSPTATNGQIDDTNNWISLSSYTDNIGQYSSGPLNQLPAGTYEAEGNWNNLIGCPLKGEWVINISDNLGADNGYLFSWEINWDTNFTDSLFICENTYNQSLFNWTGQDIVSQNNGIGTAYPSTFGVQYYTFSVTDDFACTSDTTLQVMVDDCTINFDYGSKDMFTIYPNPTVKRITVEFNNNSIDNIISIIDNKGNIIKTIYSRSVIEHVNISDLEKGVYFIKIGNITERFVKE